MEIFVKIFIIVVAILSIAGVACVIALIVSAVDALSRPSEIGESVGSYVEQLKDGFDKAASKNEQAGAY